MNERMNKIKIVDSVHNLEIIPCIENVNINVHIILYKYTRVKILNIWCYSFLV